MCLYTTQARAKTAHKDRVVYKILYQDNNSPYREYKYCPNETYTTAFTIVKLPVNYQITTGYHAYTSFRTANEKLLGPYKKIVKFIIPAGAKYYLGRRGDIVSSSVRVDSLAPITKPQPRGRL